jgi:hypothetical protein
VNRSAKGDAVYSLDCDGQSQWVRDECRTGVRFTDDLQLGISAMAASISRRATYARTSRAIDAALAAVALRQPGPVTVVTANRGHVPGVAMHHVPVRRVIAS